MVLKCLPNNPRCLFQIPLICSKHHTHIHFDFSLVIIYLFFLCHQRLLSELDDVNLQVENVREQAVILMNARGSASRELVEPKLAELNRNFEKVSQHINSAQVSPGIFIEYHFPHGYTSKW